jgi:hypothetical protein
MVIKKKTLKGKDQLKGSHSIRGSPSAGSLSYTSLSLNSGSSSQLSSSGKEEPGSSSSSSSEPGAGSSEEGSLSVKKKMSKKLMKSTKRHVRKGILASLPPSVLVHSSYGHSSFLFLLSLSDPIDVRASNLGVPPSPLEDIVSMEDSLDEQVTMSREHSAGEQVLSVLLGSEQELAEKKDSAGGDDLERSETMSLEQQIMLEESQSRALATRTLPPLPVHSIPILPPRSSSPSPHSPSTSPNYQADAPTSPTAGTRAKLKERWQAKRSSFLAHLGVSEDPQ